MSDQAAAARLHATTDALVWAQEFNRIYPDRRPDTDTMLGWFANAIEVGRMTGAATRASATGLGLALQAALILRLVDDTVKVAEYGLGRDGCPFCGGVSAHNVDCIAKVFGARDYDSNGRHPEEQRAIGVEP